MTRVALALSLLLVGSVTLEHAPRTSTMQVSEVEARLGALAPGSSAGPNGTEGAARVAGALLAATTDVLWLNNTNASGAWHVRLEVESVTGLANLASLTVGIDNGTRTAQVKGTLGALTQSTGTHVRLAPASQNKLYVTQAVATPGLESLVRLRVVAADAPDEAAYVVTTVDLTVK